jgi:hypothetical protein
MGLTRKDALATVLTGLAVLVFAATYQGWDVWLIGSSHRWAAVAIAALGIATCSLSPAGAEMGKGTKMDGWVRFLAALGVVAGILAVWAIVAGSLTPLSLLVVAMVVLWAGATLRHVAHGSHGPVTT